MMRRTAFIREYQPAEEMTEGQLQANVNHAFREIGAEFVYHTTFSFASPASFPDTFVIFHDRVIVIELKKEKGIFKPTRLNQKNQFILGQLDILELFIKTGKIEGYTMKPSEWYAGKFEHIIAGTEPMADIPALRKFEGKSNLSKFTGKEK